MEYITFEGESFGDAMQKMYLTGMKQNILDRMQIIKRFEEEKVSFFGLKKKKHYKIIVNILDSSIKSLRTRPQDDGVDLFHSGAASNASISNVPSYARNITKKEEPLPHKETIIADKKLIEENAQIKTEMVELKKMMSKMQEAINIELNDLKDSFMTNQISQGIQQDSKLMEEVEQSKQNIQWAAEFLRERTFAKFLIDDIVNYLKSLKKEVLLDRSRVLITIRDFLKANVSVENISLDDYNFGNYILFAGPTGVGKTITIVKMAAHIAAMRQRTMRFISIDRYKVGADSQIKTYAEYLKSEFHPIHKQDEFFDLIEKNNAYYTFIDTAGKSPKETIAIKELGDWIKQIGQKIDVHLVVSATTKPEDLTFIVEKYSYLPINHIIATKLDETLYLGSILSVLYKTKKPLSFVTNGQEVPQDFEIANLDKIIADSLK